MASAAESPTLFLKVRGEYRECQLVRPAMATPPAPARRPMGFAAAAKSADSQKPTMGFGSGRGCK